MRFELMPVPSPADFFHHDAASVVELTKPGRATKPHQTTSFIHKNVLFGLPGVLKRTCRRASMSASTPRRQHDMSRIKWCKLFLAYKTVRFGMRGGCSNSNTIFIDSRIFTSHISQHVDCSSCSCVRGHLPFVHLSRRQLR